MTLLWMPQPVAEKVACGWCDALPGEPHVNECPNREDGPDFPARCGRCGVTYTTTCDCEVE